MPSTSSPCQNLAAEDTEAAGIVEFRFSAGLSVREAARRTGIVALMMHPFATTTAEQALKSGKSPTVTEVQRPRSGDLAGRRWQLALIRDKISSQRADAARPPLGRPCRLACGTAGSAGSRAVGGPIGWGTARQVHDALPLLPAVPRSSLLASLGSPTPPRGRAPSCPVPPPRTREGRPLGALSFEAVK